MGATISSDITLTQSSVGGLKVTPVEQGTPYFNMLVYGNSGVGKTRLVGSAAEVAELSPVLFIDIEGGTMSVRDLYPSIDTVRITTWKEMQAVYNDLYDGKTGYKTIILDSLTEIQKFSMVMIMDELVRKNPDRDRDVPSEREWGKNLEQVRRFVRGFRDLPMNTLFTGLALEDKDQKTGITTIKPSLTGKSKNELPGFLDIVLYMYIKDGERMVLSTSTDKVSAKDRSDKLPQTLKSPTMKSIHQIITGDKSNA